jgi:integrase/recombinase XerC
MTDKLAPIKPAEALPPILAGRETAIAQAHVGNFYASIAEIFEAWIARRKSSHTQRAYRQDVMSLVEFVGIDWPEDSMRILQITILDVLAFRDHMISQDLAPKTLNRRISSVSSFYKYLAAAAAEMRLPITVPNPAHAQFIGRESSDPRDETKALSASRARQLINIPSGDSILEYRDRAILKLYVYSGIRLSTGCRLKVSDFHQDGDAATIRLHEKGDKRRTIGLHYAAAQAISEYLEAAGLTSGPLFRPRINPRSPKLAARSMNESTMYRVIQHYLEQIPGAMREISLPDGRIKQECVYTPHSMRATNATLLLDVGVDIRKVQELLGHRHVTTTQIYDKRRRTTAESASHDVPI